MSIKASQVKELRERTGAGMMECKKALVESDGDMDAAVEYLRKSGIAKADKKASRTAAEGRIGMAVSDDGKRAALVEVNCETDFVAKDDNFIAFAEEAAEVALANGASEIAGISELPMKSGTSVADSATELVAKLGENIVLRRVAPVDAGDGVLGAYVHGARIGAVVAVTGGDEALARDVAMHVAASHPLFVDEDEVPAENLEKERDILKAQAESSGKPEKIIEKMVEGRLGKYLAGITLVGQPFVKDPDQTVGQLLKDAGATVTGFARLEVGEGIEKEEEDFAEEVMAQARG